VHTIGGLQLTTVQDIPGAEPVSINYVLARATVSVVAVANAEVANAEGAPVPESPSDGADVASPPVPREGLSAEAGQGEFDLPPSVEPAAAPELAEQAPVASGVEDIAEPSPLVVGAVRNPLTAPRSDSSLLYLVLVLGALSAFVGSQLFSRFGVLLYLREASPLSRSAAPGR
jgi:hypothetical protein